MPDSLFQGITLIAAGAKFDFDIAPAAIRGYLRLRGINVSQLENTIIPNLGNAGTVVRNIDYIVKMGELLPKAFSAFLQGKNDDLRNLILEVGSETAALVQREQLSGGLGAIPHAAKTVEAFQKIQELASMRSSLDNLGVLDQRDKDYIDWTIKSYQWDLAAAAAQVAEDIARVAGLTQQPWFNEFDNLHKGADSIKSAFSNASDTFAQQNLRRDYQNLQTQYEVNQIAISSLSSFSNNAATEVGRYLTGIS